MSLKALKDSWEVPSMSVAETRIGSDGTTFFLAGKMWSDFLISEGLLPKHSLLDLGCGVGRVGIHLIQYLHENYEGCDISESMIELAGHYTSYPECFKVIDGVSLPYKDDSFDFVFGLSVFTHTPLEIATKLFKEVNRVLKPTGKIYLSLITEGSSLFQEGSTRAGGDIGKISWSRKEWELFVKENGLKIEWRDDIKFVQVWCLITR